MVNNLFESSKRPVDTAAFEISFLVRPFNVWLETLCKLRVRNSRRMLKVVYVIDLLGNVEFRLLWMMLCLELVNWGCVLVSI